MRDDCGPPASLGFLQQRIWPRLQPAPPISCAEAALAMNRHEPSTRGDHHLHAPSRALHPPPHAHLASEHEDGIEETLCANQRPVLIRRPETLQARVRHRFISRRLRELSRASGVSTARQRSEEVANMSQKAACFLGLPLELRNEVYGYLYTSNVEWQYAEDDQTIPSIIGMDWAPLVPLLCVNRQVQNEYLDVFSQRAALILNASSHLRDHDEFATKIPSYICNRLRQYNISIGWEYWTRTKFRRFTDHNKPARRKHFLLPFRTTLVWMFCHCMLTVRLQACERPSNRLF